MALPDERDPERLRRLLVVAGWAAAAVVAVGTVTAGLPSGTAGALLVPGLTAVALAGWLLALSARVTGVRVLAAVLLLVGLAGALLDLLRPSGPGFVLAFMAMAASGMRLPRRAALRVGGAVAVAAGAAEAATSAQPVSAALNIAVGAGFLLVAAAFAAANRDATEQARARLREEEAARAAREEAAVLAERGRIARELHDVLAHTLSGLSLQLEGARLLAERTGADPRLATQVAAAQGLARDGMTSARRAVATLRGEVLPGAADVADLVEQARLRSGDPVTYTVRGGPADLPPERGLALYRVVQEALSNVAKHARGARTRVVVAWHPHEVRVEVVDDGGTETGLPSGGAGLSGLAERAALAGGRLESGPAGSGWRVALTLPTRPGDGPDPAAAATAGELS